MICWSKVYIHFYFQTKVAWGTECQQYAVITKAEAGILGEFPAVRLELEWERLPILITNYAKK